MVLVHCECRPGRRVGLAALWALALCSSLLTRADARASQIAAAHGGRNALRRMHENAAHHSSEAGSGHQHTAPPKEFIYVYDMPAEFADDLKELPAQWHPEQYDYDQVRAYTGHVLHHGPCRHAAGVTQLTSCSTRR